MQLIDLSGFRAALLQWFARGHRDLPWRRTRDPYRIWLSEIMLQQTRATAAIPYYEEFLLRFPDIASLARAPESEVLAAWSGLGYYRRARNFHALAQAVAEKGGDLPRTHEGLLALPGIGPYTAAAVASIAFGLPHAVLDGNVVRVISRLIADSGDTASSATRARFQQAATALLDPRQPANFNQAMMELGATVCLPRDPLCLTCPVAAFCAARAQGRQSEFPVKLRKAAPIEEAIKLAVVRRGARVLMLQRAASSRRMADFWELPQLNDLPELTGLTLAGEFRHTIVNHRYNVSVYTGRAQPSPPMQWISAAADPSIPITTMTRKALRLFKKR